MLRALKSALETALDKQPTLIAETGAGNTTILFLMLEPRQLYSISSERGLKDRIVSHCAANSVSVAPLDFRDARSELVLPELAASLKAANRKLDVALMDGVHGWPTVFVEFCYFHAMLRKGGLLIVDDVQLYSVAEFTRWLSMQKEYSLVKNLKRMMVFRKEVSSDHFRDFSSQPYIQQQTMAQRDLGSA
jgi:hypothetical protein